MHVLCDWRVAALIQGMWAKSGHIYRVALRICAPRIASSEAKHLVLVVIEGSRSVMVLQKAAELRSLSTSALPQT